MENNTPAAKNKSPRYTELDGLRGIAVLYVMLFHYTISYDDRYHLSSANKFFIPQGTMAVYLFFMISGFVIFMTVERSEKKLDFVVSRFSRLYPAYWVSLIITLLFLYFWPVPTLNFKLHPLNEILVNFTMLQRFVSLRDVEGAYWSLNVELTFYGMMFILSFYKKFSKSILLICSVWFLMSFISLIITLPHKAFIDRLFNLQPAPLFISGILFYKIKTNTLTGIKPNLLIVMCFFLQLGWLFTDSATYFLSIVLLLLIFGVFYFFAYGSVSFLNNRVLLFFGSISYSLYLIHNVVGMIIIYHIRQYTNVQLFYILPAAAIVILLAYLVSKWVERPMLKLIRKTYYKNK